MTVCRNSAVALALVAALALAAGAAGDAASRRSLLQPAPAPAAAGALPGLVPKPRSAGKSKAAAGDDANPARVAPVANPPCCAALPAGYPHDLPVVIIDTKGKELPFPQQTMIPGQLCTCNAPGGADYDAPITVRIRGSSSAQQQKQKSMAFDVYRPGNASAKGQIEFMGFPEHNQFILYAPVGGDNTLGMHNWLAYTASRRMGRYATRTRYVEVFLNQDGKPLGVEHYWGVFIAGESTARGKDRVNIKKFDPASGDLSGGWMFRYENDNTAGNDFFDTKQSKLTFLVDYPGKKQATQDHLYWIEKYMNQYEDALLSGNLTAINEYLDWPAAIDYFLGTEITKTPDGYRGSVKMSKDKDGPLVMGPLWDYDEAFGACCGYPIEGWKNHGESNGTSGGSAISPEGWRFNICNDPGRCKVEPLDGVSQWYRRLWLEPQWRADAAARWAELRQERLSDAWFVEEIATVKAQIANASDRTFLRWKAELADPLYPAGWRAQWDAAVERLQTWLLAHLAWMDQAFAKQAVPGSGPLAYLQPGPAVAASGTPAPGNATNGAAAPAGAAAAGAAPEGAAKPAGAAAPVPASAPPVAAAPQAAPAEPRTPASG